MTLTATAVAEAVADSPDALARLAAALSPVLTARPTPSPYMTIPEAADRLRCKRQRIDDLLSARKLTRYKDGRRTLVLRAEVDALPILGSSARSGDTLVTPPTRS